MALIDDTRYLLTSKFPGAEVRLTRLPGGRVGGTLLWKGFAGKEQIDRQVLLREAVDTGLPAEKRLQVSFILTLTPDEQAALAAQ